MLTQIIQEVLSEMNVAEEDKEQQSIAITGAIKEGAKKYFLMVTFKIYQTISIQTSRNWHTSLNISKKS